MLSFRLLLNKHVAISRQWLELSLEFRAGFWAEDTNLRVINMEVLFKDVRLVGDAERVKG